MSAKFRETEIRPAMRFCGVWRVCFFSLLFGVGEDTKGHDGGCESGGGGG